MTSDEFSRLILDAPTTVDLYYGRITGVTRLDDVWNGKQITAFGKAISEELPNFRGQPKGQNIE